VTTDADSFSGHDSSKHDSVKRKRCCEDDGGGGGACAESGCGGYESGIVLPELLGAIEREPVQDELQAVRILFELLGFLLSWEW
jgi:hypothetical protein